MYCIYYLLQWSEVQLKMLWGLWRNRLSHLSYFLKASGLKTIKNEAVKPFFMFTCCCWDKNIPQTLLSGEEEPEAGDSSGGSRYLQHSCREHPWRKASNNNELLKDLPTWTSASKSSKLKAAITSLTILQQNSSRALLPWWKTEDDQHAPEVSRFTLSETSKGRKLKRCEDITECSASSLWRAHSKACWRQLDFLCRCHQPEVTSHCRALLSADFKGSNPALEKRGTLSNKHQVRAGEVTHHSTALMETLRGENIKIFTRIWKLIPRSLSGQPFSICFPCLHAQKTFF